MRRWVVLGCLFLAACVNEAEERSVTSQSISTQTTLADTSENFAQDTLSQSAISVPAIKRPSGFYQFIFPFDAKMKVLHTISFYPTTYRLQEEFLGKKDSIVVTTGTWAPSQGFIWLYKEQLVRGRYTWNGDTLQYFSPALNRKFSLTKLTPASSNPVWQRKKNEGAVLFGVGNEPFWSIEIKNRDSMVLSMPDWKQSLRVKASETTRGANSTIYRSSTDSLQVTVLPYFCSDGMSDYIYSHKVTVNYKGKTYHGCGIDF